MSIFYSFPIGYLFGFFPTADTIFNWSKNIDSTTTCSGNVGTLNSFKVSKSKWIALPVFAIALLNGFISMILALLYYRQYVPLHRLSL